MATSGKNKVYMKREEEMPLRQVFVDCVGWEVVETGRLGWVMVEEDGQGREWVMFEERRIQP